MCSHQRQFQLTLHKNQVTSLTWKLVHPPGVLVGATRSRARSGGSRLSVGCVNGNLSIPLESWLERLGPGLGVGAVGVGIIKSN